MKADPPEFCRELLAAGYCCDDLGFGRAAFRQPLFGVRMQGDFHISILISPRPSESTPHFFLLKKTN